uniref:Uncharacterized protein n=1 Tax=Molossus molossus TaxID=27622 RepID=A0A7J8FRZ0_MOLMO|nr:hypothetical protein HJG59_008386 [Molossus molossus]
MGSREERPGKLCIWFYCARALRTALVGHPCPPAAGTPAVFPAASVHTPARAECAFRGSDRDSVSIAVKTCFSCSQPATARRSCRPGIWGRRGWETWGGSREVMAAADLRKNKTVLYMTHLHHTF